MKKAEYIKCIFGSAASFIFSNIFSVLIYAQIYTYVLLAFGIDGYVCHLIYCAGMLPGYFHSIYIFAYNSEKVRTWKEIIFSPDFITANTVYLILTALIAPDFALFHVSAAVLIGKPVSYALKKIMISLIMLTVNFILHLLAYRLADAKNSENKRGIKDTIISVLIALLFYLMALGIVIKCVVVIFSYIFILLRMVSHLIPILLFTCIIIAVTVILRRISFLRALRRICENREYCLRGVGSKFFLMAQGKAYVLKTVSFGKFILNAVLWCSKNSFRMSRFKGLRNILIKIMGFKAGIGEEKIFIIIPIFGKGCTGKNIENGGTVDEYRVFYAKGFLRALEMGYISKQK